MIFKVEKNIVHFGRQQFRINSGAAFFILVVLAIAVGSAGTAIGKPSCCTVGGAGGWSADDKLNEIGSNSANSVQQNSENVLQNPSTNEQKKVVPSADDAAISAKSLKQVETLANLSEIHNSDVILDVNPLPQSNIKGAVHIDYREFLDGYNRPRSISTLSKILGDAGISRGDSVVIESKNPSDATYVYLILDYLGQEGVKLLDSHIGGETPADKSIESAPTVKPKTKYTPSPKIDLIASYDYVKRKDVQVVDARPSREYSVGSVHGSKNIPYDMVLDGEKIKDQAVLGTLFAELSRDKPVAVYSNDGIKASLLWYALKLEGYNTSLYAGDNWATNLLEHDEGAGKSLAESGLATTPVSSDGSVVPNGSGGSTPKCH
ncbi:Rhodanese-like domain protein [uncultured archaeon]|nr:Rhodanese-like domain protein [uncultured archaeon]